MIFHISRTSVSEEDQPSEESYKAEYTMKYKELRKQSEAWFIEIATLEDLLAFLNKHNLLVLKSKAKYDDVPEIEIYDDYRE